MLRLISHTAAVEQGASRSFSVRSEQSFGEDRYPLHRKIARNERKMSVKRLVLPRLYVILDAALITVPETDFAQKLVNAGVRLLQYRNKRASARELFECSRRLSSLLIPQGVSFIVNDRADVASAAEASGVHVGQEDLRAEAARSVIGAGKLLGVSTHNLEQFREAAATSADAVAVGPVFSTSTKASPDPVVGIELIRT